MTLFRNMQGNYAFGGQANRILGQFSLELVVDASTGNLVPDAIIGLGNNYAEATGTANLSLNAWHNIAFSADGAQLRLYVDGALVATKDYTGLINKPTYNWISVGARVATDTNTTPPSLVLDDPNNSDLTGATSPNVLMGSLDDLGLWARALTDAEVTAIYQAGLNGKSLTSVQESPPAQAPTLTAVKQGNNIIISWTPTGGTLQSAPALVPGGSTWTPVGTANPATVPIGAANSFFRVQQ
jgi:hypothetical protein